MSDAEALGPLQPIGVAAVGVAVSEDQPVGCGLPADDPRFRLVAFSDEGLPGAGAPVKSALYYPDYNVS